ncbi:ACT domain-containing protein [Herbiconiux sp. CPCC 205763]|uniref:ACT domain-containing protein n=1 Tax=Herbiconiux aconitum TaxID=2970913 RepID=A0ABT2GUZ9_9MICO|nr:ACT domain-containing protein [Herbiconiux aconitum]MCS5719372.1 ACT domain-containing protein [Herbiconiux aconitum]
MSGADHQTLRVLEGRYVLERLSGAEAVGDDEVLAIVRGPDGGARMRRNDATVEAWVALWNGDAAHPPDATGMCAAIVAPLAAGGVPVWVAASFDGDIVLIPGDSIGLATELLQKAGHRVTGASGQSL